jgi:hypothetical protein
MKFSFWGDVFYGSSFTVVQLRHPSKKQYHLWCFLSKTNRNVGSVVAKNIWRVFYFTTPRNILLLLFVRVFAFNAALCRDPGGPTRRLFLSRGKRVNNAAKQSDKSPCHSSWLWGYWAFCKKSVRGFLLSSKIGHIIRINLKREGIAQETKLLQTSVLSLRIRLSMFLQYCGRMYEIVQD